MSFLSDAAGKIVVTVAGASIVTLGGAVVGSARTNAEQEVRLESMKEREVQIAATLRNLDEAVRQLDKNVAVLNERLQEK